MTTKLGRLSLGPRSPGRDGLNPHAPDYVSSGLELRDHLIRHAGLHPGSHVLDLGCGTGRLAHALRDYLVEGTYRGVDLRSDHVRRCRANFRFRRGFSFLHLNSYHQEWNPGGDRPYLIPYEPGSLDLVVAVGVLYHLDFPGAAELIHQVAPLLKSYGFLAATARLLNHHSMAHLRPDQYPHRTLNSWHSNPDRPLLDVALPEEGFRRLLIRNRLQVREPVRYGRWSSAGGPLDADLLTAVKV